MTLTPYELHLAASVGVRRQIEAMSAGRPDRHGHSGAGWNLHLEGACGELAVAKALGRYWDGSVNTFKKGGDVGAVQVRTRSKHEYELIVRQGDRDSDVFVLVTGVAPSYRVRGWLRGGDAKRPEWEKTHGDRPPAWFVPHAALKSFPESMVTVAA